jgi:type VI secretion system protein ImpE
VLTSTGKYYVLPIERVDYVEFRAPERPCDLMWRRAEMSVRDGPEGEVFLPSIYVPPAGEVDDLARLGRSTSWVNAEDGPTRGVGQRSFLVGEDDIPIMRIGRIEFAPAAA